MKFRAQILGGFALLVALIALQAWVVYPRLEESRKNLSSASSTDEIAELSVDLQRTLLEIYTDRLVFVLTGDESKRESFVQKDSLFHATLNRTREMGSGLADVLVQVAHIEGEYRTWFDLMGGADETVANLRAAARESGEQIKTQSATLKESIVRLSTVAFEQDDQIRGAALRSSRSATNTLLICGILSLVLGIALSIGLGRSLIRQVGDEPENLVDVATELALGNSIEAYSDVAHPTGVAASLKELARSNKLIADQAKQIADGKFDISVPIRSEADVLGLSLADMVQALREGRRLSQHQLWLSREIGQLIELAQGGRTLAKVSESVLTRICSVLNVGSGVLYVRMDGSGPLDDQSASGQEFRLAATYAFDNRQPVQQRIALGEGLVGQAAKEGRTILQADIDPGHVHLVSGTGDSKPVSLAVVPMLFGSSPAAILELAAFRPFTTEQHEFLDLISERLGVVFNTSIDRARIDGLLIEAQELAEEVQAQSEELQAQNDELDSRRELLEKQAEEREAILTQIRENEARLQVLFSEVPYAIITVDETGRIKDINPMAETSFGYTREEFRERNVSSLFVQEWQAAMRSGSQNADEAPVLQARTKSDKLIHVELQTAPIEMDGEARTLIVLADVSLRKLREEEMAHLNDELQAQAAELEIAKDQLEERAEQLEQADKYKSEFLANMSHELRTPLNSMLVLSRMLAEEDEDLNEEQREAATVIHTAGIDLRDLINDILDLSKVEAGKIVIRPEDIVLKDLVHDLKRQFDPLVADKDIALAFELSDATPETIVTDSQRLSQILKNLLSNAIKFTAEGQVSLSVDLASEGGEGDQPLLSFVVSDTGLGIPEDQQATVFEAFHQVDGSTSRKFGGTGLGLSISQKMAALLGGEITLTSTPGQGSVFTLRLPEHLDEAGKIKESSTGMGTGKADKKGDHKGGGVYRGDGVVPENGKTHRPPDMREENQDSVTEPIGQIDSDLDRPTVMIVEDDRSFGSILLDRVRRHGFNGMVIRTGNEAVIAAHEHHPMGILLDLKLPDIDGKKVLTELKRTPVTRDIPVFVISGAENLETCLRLGAIGFHPKPIETEEIDRAIHMLRRVSEGRKPRLIVVDSNDEKRRALVRALSIQPLDITGFDTAESALGACATQHIDGVIVANRLSDMAGLEFLELFETRQQGDFPYTIVLALNEISETEYISLGKYTESIVLDGPGSIQRLTDEFTLFLVDLAGKRKRLASEHANEGLRANDEYKLTGKKILIVDDDTRNTFALGRLLKKKGVDVIPAENGKVALEKLDADPSVDLILMDVMMPVMDGIEATRRIKADSSLQTIPIIAVTAKAMPQDRKTCLDAGADDYITKPLEIDQLLHLIRLNLAHVVV